MQPNPSGVIETDVLVIGGGPAGSTAATFLARKGRRVLLAEKERHPRFHIGESLLPMSMPIFDRLGVSEAIRSIGVVKLGADFPAANEHGYNVFRFANMLRPVYGYAYQVKREEFDQVLFEHARKSGAQAIEGCRIEDVQFDNDRVSARAQFDDGTIAVINARYVLDASGRNTFLGTQFGLKKRHRRHQSAALFAHFHGVERRPGTDAGNISIYQFEHGWVWVIPLRDDVTSVGAVCNPEYLKQRSTNNAEFLMTTLRRIEPLAQRLQTAAVAGNVHATGNYSYICRRWSGPRWLMIGDACAFLDPIFSTGVYLAMRSAERASETVNAILQEPGKERSLQRKYRREVRHGLGIFSWFIFRFTTPAMAWLFANPRNVLGIEQAVISMLAGDIFENEPALRRLHIFRGLYLLQSLRTFKQSVASMFARRRRVHAQFVGGTTRQDLK
jgi:flavin-dependent dehydrogenase